MENKKHSTPTMTATLDGGRIRVEVKSFDFPAAPLGPFEAYADECRIARDNADGGRTCEVCGNVVRFYKHYSGYIDPDTGYDDGPVDLWLCPKCGLVPEDETKETQ